MYFYASCGPDIMLKLPFKRRIIIKKRKVERPMDTLIEMYDERAIENILAPDMFRPKRIVYLCPGEIVMDHKRQDNLRAFFNHRGWEPEIIFMESSLFKADRILQQLQSIAEKYPDCALDITGGSDAALFAGGMFAAQTGTPAFTYSRKKNSFYDISGAAFAENLTCDCLYTVEEFFQMAGGTLLPGRVDNAVLSRYLKDFEPFFQCFLQFRRDWSDIISYMQKISPSEYGQTPPMFVQGKYTVKGERGSRNCANEAALREFERIGFIRDLDISKNESVSFHFRDVNIRAWLRDVGSVLELYAYKACIDSGIFNDVISSAVVRWDDVLGHGSVMNEIDVMAARGVIPLFISCKACDIKTEAINELSILRDRFGGKGAKAAIISTERCNAAARHRAAQLGIAVIDREELGYDQLIQRLKVIMKVQEIQ